MAQVTNRGMLANPTRTDQWISQPFKRGAGVFVGRITPKGERLFYFRYTNSAGQRPFFPLGPFHPDGTAGSTVKEAYARACELSDLYRKGVRDIHAHLKEQQADKRRMEDQQRCDAARAAQEALLVQARRITVRQLFDHWLSVELTPQVSADGHRRGRKDG